MQEISYQFPMFERLQPHSEWRGGRMTNIDLLTLEDAARMASKHSGEEVRPADFLRAAGRGEVLLRAIVHRTAKVHAHDGGVLFNKGGASENIVPAGSIPTLPLTACQHLAATGRASWRTFDGFEKREGTLMRYTKGMLTDDEPDFETVPGDCRVMGNDVHALADAYCAPEDAPQAATPAPVVAESANDAPGNGRVWTPEKLAEAKAYRETHGTKKTAKHYQVSEARIRRLLPSDTPKPKGYSAFTHRPR